MLGMRMAMDKLREFDAAYANQVGKLVNSNLISQVVGSKSPYVAGMMSPFANIQKARQQINDQKMTADARNVELRKALQAELGAAGRYAIPAAGVGLAGVGTAAMLNNGSGYEIDYSSPAHGGNLSPQSHELYIDAHQALMSGDPHQVDHVRLTYAAGVYDHDPLLKAHIADVMG